MELIDYRAVLVDGAAYAVLVVADRDSLPHHDEWPCSADIERWYAGDWRYVGLIVRSDTGREASLWGIAFGSSLSFDVTTDYLMSEDYYVPSLIAQVSQ